VWPSAMCVALATHPRDGGLIFLKALIVSATFGGVVLALRAATPAAAICGAMVCLLITAGTARADGMPFASGLSPLMMLFVLTFVSTRLGRAKKTKAGLAESRKGRNAAQILANLGAAGLVVPVMAESFIPRFALIIAPVLVLAALCEATADTVSSEIGQAFGGQPLLLTTLRRVEPGTDGAVSLLGTAAGILAAGVVAATGFWAMRMTPAGAGIALSGGIAGLIFDSLLGATVERKGWLGNDLVNFSSTVFAVGIALGLLVVWRF
jgi:uncharacterized protein (TIGR00297 family)